MIFLVQIIIAPRFLSKSQGGWVLELCTLQFETFVTFTTLCKMINFMVETYLL